MIKTIHPIILLYIFKVGDNLTRDLRRLISKSGANSIRELRLFLEERNSSNFLSMLELLSENEDTTWNNVLGQRSAKGW